MGCFNVCCGISHLSILYGERAFLFPLLPTISRLSEAERSGIIEIPPKSAILSPTEFYTPFCFPIEGIYNDYGSLEKIVKNDNTDAIEKFLNISIEDLVKVVTESSGKNPYNTMDALYSVFFSKKDLMKREVPFADFLLGLGFEKDENAFSYPDTQFVVKEEKEEGKTRYAIFWQGEKLPADGEYLCLNVGKYRSDDLSDPWFGKELLLRCFLEMTGKYIGIDNLKAFHITRRLSAMFVHGEVFDGMTQRGVTLGQKKKNMPISKLLLRNLGFNYDGKTRLWYKGGLRVEMNYPFAKICQQDGMIKNETSAHDCGEFLRIYKKCTKENLSITPELDLDETEILYEDMIFDYRVQNLFYKGLEDNTDFKTDRSYLIYGVNGLMTFYQWEYFVDIYNEQMLNFKIKDMYIKFMRFEQYLWPANRFYFPSFSGEQGGNLDKEKKLADVTSRIMKDRVRKEKEEL